MTKQPDLLAPDVFDTLTLDRRLRLRAVETDRYLLCAGTTGISAIVDPAGQLLQQLEMGKQGIIYAEFQPRTSMTPYVRFDEWRVGGDGGRSPRDGSTPYTTFVIRQVVASIALVALTRCATPSPSAPVFEHLDECVNPDRESMSWRLFQGRVIEVTSARTFRLRTDEGYVMNVSLANVGEPVDAEAMDFLRKMIGRKRVSVMGNPSKDHPRDIVGEVDERKAGEISRQMLRAGAAAFVKEPAYTLSDYSECLHRIAEREAKAARVGIWH